ncbi:MAG: ABC transporter permease [Acidobacteria bacterium]|nr:ABC transporter permease [Acidobacteriota bacterium]
MRSLLNDARFATRILMRNPALTLVAALSLGLGIGANTTIFTLVNEVFLNPLPMHEPSRLVGVFTTDERNRSAGFFGNANPMSRLNFEDLRDRNQVLEGMAAAGFIGVGVSDGQGEPEQVFGQIATDNYFSLLGAPMAAGRAFTPGTDRTPGASPEVVLSYGLWQRRFGGDPGVVGRTVTLNGHAYTVVGVTAEAFRGTGAIGGPALWVPFSMYREATSGFIRETWDSRRALVLQVVGRLAPGVSLEAAGANLAAIGASLAADYPDDNRGRGVVVQPLADVSLSPSPAQRQQLAAAGGLLMAIVGLVLLVACANVANLMLARAAARRQEIAVRVSLGAGRGRLVRQLLVESVMLGLLGGVVGLLAASWSRSALVALRPPFLPEDALGLPMDWRVLLFTSVVALGTGLLFGLFPALQFSRPDLAVELKDRSSQANSGGGRVSVRNALVVGQVALSMVALICAGLFLRSLGNARQIDPGFDLPRLAVLSFDLASRGLPIDAAVARQREILDRARAFPAVERATLANATPLAGGGFARTVFQEGQDTSDPRAGRFVQITVVGDGYFGTTGIPIVRGRDFGAADTPESPQVVIINETMAERFWPGEEAIGRRFRFSGQQQLTEVVGVARDSKYNFIGEEPQPHLYQPLGQAPQTAVTLILRTDNPEAALGAVRSAVQQMEPTMPLTGVFTMAAIFDQALWAARMGATLLGVFGVLALLLAAVGVYGVMAYSVSQRTREIGVRLALGASEGLVQRQVLGQGLLLTGIGVIAGLAGGITLNRFIVGLMYDVSPYDPVTLAAIPAILLAVAALAIYIPARRASRVDPVVALRSS